jgi:DNA recombination-dependent growth factor C
MRIKILRLPSVKELDGIDLRHFFVGQKYEVGNGLGAVMLAEGWAEPLADDAPALLIPLSETVSFVDRTNDRNAPADVIRRTDPAYTDTLAAAADSEHRRRKRPPSN